jgi:hypothetical protein
MLRIGSLALLIGVAAAALPKFWPFDLKKPWFGTGDLKKQYWATSLTRTVEPSLLDGLREALARGETGWLDIDPKFPVPPIAPGTNLIFYHVGGNCYVGADCARFSKSEQINGLWSEEEQKIDLSDEMNRKIVIADLVQILQHADQVAPKGSVIGVHVDNLHRVEPVLLAQIFNELSSAVDAAKRQGLIAKERVTGYIAKNNPSGFINALDAKLLEAPPFYVINENATLDENGVLDDNSRDAQELGERYGIPVFLKTFGSDIAYTIERAGQETDVFVSPDMTRKMTELPNISGAAWSIDEERYHPMYFFQGSPVRQAQIPASH